MARLIFSTGSKTNSSGSNTGQSLHLQEANVELVHLWGELNPTHWGNSPCACGESRSSIPGLPGEQRRVRSLRFLKSFNHHMGVSKYRGPQNGWFIRENPIKIHDLGVPCGFHSGFRSICFYFSKSIFSFTCVEKNDLR